MSNRRLVDAPSTPRKRTARSLITMRTARSLIAIRTARSLIAFTTAWLVSVGAAPAMASFDHPDFADLSGLSLQGDAVQAGTSLLLTAEARHQQGAVWSQERQAIAGGFSTTVRFQIDNLTPIPASGLVLLFHDDPAGDTTSGSPGNDLGYSGIANGVLAVELDTFGDRGVELRTGVPDFDAVGSDGVVTPGSMLPAFNLFDGVPRDLTVQYDAALSLVVVSIDDPDPAAQDFHQVYALDLGPMLPADGKAWVGLMASTGSFDSQHVVHAWSFSNVADADGDGLADDVDNCPLDPNPEQTDLDGDGLGDACDEDADGDGVPYGEDNCPWAPNAEQTDLDGDGWGDACDADVDGDGVDDAHDSCPWVANPDQVDFDGDGLGDVCDEDADADGLPDADGDVCALSPLDEPVDSRGCTVSQYVPCEGPAGSDEPSGGEWSHDGKKGKKSKKGYQRRHRKHPRDDSGWRSQGHYLRELVHTLRHFLRERVLSRREAWTILLEGVREQCGR